QKKSLGLAVFLLAMAPLSAIAADVASPLAQCAVLVDDGARLRCYDQLAAGRTSPPAGEAVVAEGGEEVPPEAAATVDARDTPSGSLLAAHWELDAANDRGRYN